MWCGAEAACLAGGSGYGNNWVQDLTKFFPATPSGILQVRALRMVVANLPVLNRHQINGLHGKLKEAVKKLEQNQPDVAINKLQDFIDQR